MLMQNDPFRDLDSVFSRFTRNGLGGGPALPIDAYRRGNDVWVHMDVPGVPLEDLDISVERGVLTISAQRSWTREDGDRSYFAERQSGAFKPRSSSARASTSMALRPTCTREYSRCAVR